MHRLPEHMRCYELSSLSRERSSCITSSIFRMDSPRITFCTSSASSVSCSTSAFASCRGCDRGGNVTTHQTAVSSQHMRHEHRGRKREYVPGAAPPLSTSEARPPVTRPLSVDCQAIRATRTKWVSRGTLWPPYTASLTSQARQTAACTANRLGGTRGHRGLITWGDYVPADFVFDFILLFGTDRVFPVAEVNGANLVGITPVLRWRTSLHQNPSGSPLYHREINCHLP